MRDQFGFLSVCQEKPSDGFVASPVRKDCASNDETIDGAEVS